MGQWGDEGKNLRPIKKLSLGAGYYVEITWEGFFTQSFSFLKWRRSQVDRHHTFTIWFKLSSQHSDKGGFPSSCNIKTIFKLWVKQ